LAARNFQKKIAQICPYWQIWRCALKTGTEGIYIPLDTHIEFYCESSEHKLCPRHTEYAVKKPLAGTNKRKRVRIVNHQPITIIPLNNSGNVTSKKACKTTTLDLSLDGMRVMTNEPILKNSLIEFSLDNSTLDEHHHCIAISRWCLPSLDTEGYQVGFAFYNKETTQAISDCWNLAIN